MAEATPLTVYEKSSSYKQSVGTAVNFGLRIVSAVLTLMIVLLSGAVPSSRMTDVALQLSLTVIAHSKG